MMRQLPLATVALGFLTLLLATSSSLLSQQDVRVSTEPSTSILPLDAQLAASASSGSRSLVVWGTTRLDPDSGIVNTLRMQMLEGTGLLGAQRSLTETAARPYEYVNVIPVADGFLVIWNDRRYGAPGVYSRKVALDGTLSGTEQRFSIGLISTRGSMQAYGSPATGQLLVWQDRRDSLPGYYARRVNASGDVTGTEQRLGGSLDNFYTFSGLPGLTLLEMNGNYTLIHDGGIDPRTIPLARFATPYHLGQDSSLISLRGDSVLFYRSLFDILPQKIYRVTALDSAEGGTAMVTRDSAGVIHAYFNRVSVSGTTTTTGVLEIDAYDVRVTDDSIEAPRYAYHNLTPNGYIPGTSYYSVRSFVRGAQKVGSNNTALATLQWNEVAFQNGSQLPAIPPTYSYFSIDTAGHYLVENDRGYQAYGNLPSRPDYVTRLLSDTLFSTVRMQIGSARVDLHADAVIDGARKNTAQVLPGITRNGESTMVSWVVPGTSSYAANAWDSSQSSPAGPPAQLSFDDPNITYSGENELVQHTRNGGESVFLTSGGASVSSSRIVRDHIIRHVGPGTAEEEDIVSSRFSLYRPTTSGWTRVLSIYDPPNLQLTSPPKPRVWHQGSITGYDPNRDEVLVRVVASSETGGSTVAHVALFARGLDSTTGWSIPGVPLAAESALLLPVDSLRYLGIVGNEATIYNNQSVVSNFFFSQPSTTPEYQRLLGDGLLRWFWSDQSRSAMRLELWTIGGTMRAAATVSLPDRNDVRVVQNPGDSSIVLLTGGSRGVRATLLDSRLNIRQEDLAISATHDTVANPSGIFLHDTLFAVWEDYRNGAADIYGTSATFTTAAAVATLSRAAAAMTISPNPARERATLTVRLPEPADIDIHLYNMLGEELIARSIAAEETGEHLYSLPLENLANGIYLVKCSAGIYNWGTTLVIAR